MNITERQRIISAIEDCTRFIDKEEKRNPNLRPAKVRELLAWYHGHRAKLQQMLTDLEG